MSIFERYAPFIQDFIYQNDWESLRAIQVAAGDAIFHTDENVLLSASTASGKTEAAFFPILTLFSENPPTSVGAIYIGPLKALINDQFLRLNDLCAEADIPVWHWHGDVSQSHKAKMMKHPSGILQITPESLEAMLLHKHAAITKLFHDLRFIVIDEVHSLMHGWCQSPPHRTFCHHWRSGSYRQIPRRRHRQRNGDSPYPVQGRSLAAVYGTFLCAGSAGCRGQSAGTGIAGTRPENRHGSGLCRPRHGVYF